jgi:hypothetical protein
MLPAGLRILLMAFAVSPFVAAQKPPAGGPISWSPIRWSSQKLGDNTLDHSALMVEFRLDGVKDPALMQLDTGCDVDLVYGASYDRLGGRFPRVARNQVSLSGRAAGSRFERERFYVQESPGGIHVNLTPLLAVALPPAGLALLAAESLPRSGGGPALLGTIGAEFLEERILLLDFVSQRVAFLPSGAALPEDVEGRIQFAPMEYRDRKIFVAVTLNGATRRDMIFDTGSSAVPIETTRRHWLEWTGRREDDAKNRLMVVNAWGKPARLVGAPLTGGLCVGAACLPAPLAYFESTGLRSLDFDSLFDTAGLIGNVPFDGRYTVVVDVPHRRFGLFAGALANAGR